MGNISRIVHLTWEQILRKAIVGLFVAALVGSPLGATAGANPIEYIKEHGVPQSGCEWQDALGIVNVKECEDNWD